MLDQPDHPILCRWLASTSCCRNGVRRAVLFENADHIVLRHYAHAEYLGRFAGSDNCGAYAALYSKADLLAERGLNNRLQLGFDPMQRWEGRLNVKQILADARALGIEFSAAGAA